jgi:arylsulfatase A-like enzyme
MATGGAAVFVLVEYPLALWLYTGPIGVANGLRLLALVATLSLFLWTALAIVLGLALTATRLVASLGETARGGAGIEPSQRFTIRTGVPLFWATVVATAVAAVAIQRSVIWALANFKEQQLTAALIAALALTIVAVAFVARRVLVLAATTAAVVLAPSLGGFNPFARWRAAGFVFATLCGAVLAVLWFHVPQSRAVFPFRIAISGIAVLLGMGMGRLYVPRILRPRRAAPWVAGGTFVLVVMTLWRFGADPETRYIAITSSPSLEKLIGLVRVLNDFDRDGFGSVLGDNDCAALEAAVNPGAIDTPDDGIDQDCDGRDLSWVKLVIPPGPKKPVPPEFHKPWNILLITIDTVRYDRTTFGGYAQKPPHRDTTPRLAELVARSTSFRFCQASAPGTMASIPAILTSRFFHSGIALQDRPGGIPPKLLPQNTTLPEIMKRGGYVTGVIGSHEWWNDWGLDQGVDEYDNSIGKNHNPFDSTADKVTDHALAFVSRHRRDKWFLWAHYLDPHGRYVAHPDVVDYGASEPDLYDAEIRWTDQQVGRLLDELRRIPGIENTIIVITSDHGDSMAEHSVPLGTHGTALYRELLHVPLIFHIPGNRPRAIDGAVTNLDIVPTVAELAGLDVSDLSFEGRSLVPALFYGIEDRNRVVFAETNAPARQRAAISEQWKLIYYFRSNLYELFDLRADPSEQTNVATRYPRELAEMRSVLQGWIARVVNARDPVFNQAYRQIADLLLGEAPSPSVKTEGQTIGDGIEILGIDSAKAQPLYPGKPAAVVVYLHVTRPTSIAYRFQLVAWPVSEGSTGTEPLPARTVQTASRLTGDGAFASDQWRAGDYIREQFTLQLPADWTGRIAIGMVTSDPDGAKLRATGDAPANDPTIAVLGTLPLAPAAAPPR